MSAADEALLERIARATWDWFAQCSHPVAGLARDRTDVAGRRDDDVVAVGGSGFGIVAMLVAVARGWLARADALARLARMLGFLERADAFHGVYPHFLDGATGRTIPFGPHDDGADLVETSFLMQGLLSARQFLHAGDRGEADLAARIDALWRAVRWDWHLRDGDGGLYWHWSPRHGWATNHEIRGWNECLVTYVLAAASPTHPIPPAAYHRGWARGPGFRNGQAYAGITLPLGPAWGGPLFFTHHSFIGLDPRGLRDGYADYWQQNVAHVRINHAYCQRNPQGYAGYGPDCWGLTASDTEGGYCAHSPTEDRGVIAPTAAAASIAYCPDLVLPALRRFCAGDGAPAVFGRYGFVDAFKPATGWTSGTHLAIDQGPIVAMIENQRSGLPWRLFMSCPEIGAALAALGFDAVPRPSAH